MKIVEATTVPVQGTSSNKAILNIPSKIASKMNIQKGDELILQLNDNNQLVIEKLSKKGE